MKKLFGYLLLIAYMSGWWWPAHIMFSRGNYVVALLCFGFGLSLPMFIILAMVYSRKLDKKHDLTGHDYEVVMTQLDRVEKLSDGYYSVYTKWVDPESGEEYFFKSDYIDFNPKRLLKSRKIPVKISIDDYKIYSVDLSMLPKRAGEKR